MPTLIAIMHRAGGLHAAVRVNACMGLLATLLFLAFIAAHERKACLTTGLYTEGLRSTGG